MTRSFSHAHQLRAELVVLSDRRPVPSAPRTEMEAAIEWALREHDGVWLARRVAAGSSAGVDEPCNGAWSALAGAPGQSRSPMEEWIDYVRANAPYAERIVEMVSPEGTVWINGHRWLLVPSALREHGHRGPIGLLLDVPFPTRDRLQALPWHADVMAALCRVDLIVFQTQACADNFESCRADRGRSGPWIRVGPNGVGSPTRFDPAAWVSGFLTLLGSAARRELQQ